MFLPLPFGAIFTIFWGGFAIILAGGLVGAMGGGAFTSSCSSMDGIGAYREFSDLGFTYGGGLRLNLFEVKGGRLRGFYGGLQAEYLAGAVAYDYSSSLGSKWKKDADWKEFLSKGELGVARPRFAAYLGGAYLHYREDTERQLLENLPTSLISYVFQDELEEESFGAYGGGVIHLSSPFLLNIQGQVFSQKSIFGALEYHF